MNRPAIGCFNWNSPNYNSIFGDILRQKGNYFEGKNWLSRAYAYWFDEPSKSIYPAIIEGMDLLNGPNGDPRLKRLLTVNHDRDPGLKADIWVPLLSNYEAGWASQRIKEGGDMWWYVCTGPRVPYTTNFIDHPGIEQRLRYWLAWQNNIAGEVYWNVNYYWSGITSFTNVTVRTGSQAFKVAPGLLFGRGRIVKIYDNVLPCTKEMEGTIISYNSTTGDLVVDIDGFVGTGNSSTWSIAFDNDPWVSPASNENTSIQTESDNFFFGNGDGRLFYPPRNWLSVPGPLDVDPIPSLRLELIRDGIEDFEYFVQLKKYIKDLENAKWYSQTEVKYAVDAKRLLTVPTGVATSLFAYTSDISNLATARQNIALRIENIRNHLAGVVPTDKPSDWTFTSSVTDVNTKIVLRTTPITTISMRNEKTGPWSLEESNYTVNPGEIWTFTAVVGGRNISSGGASLSIMAYNSSGQLVNPDFGISPALSGTFGWTKQSVTVTVPSDGSVRNLRPRFRGNSAGEYYVAYSAFNKSPSAAEVPDFSTQSLPPRIKPDITPVINLLLGD